MFLVFQFGTTLTMGCEMAKIWRCRDGRKIDIKDMQDSHLLNTINMLKRKGRHEDDEELEAFLRCSPPNGDMAHLAWENEFDELLSRPCKRKHRLYDSLVGEAMRRGIYDQT